VKGFSEALLEDFRLNAPHVKVAVVMPGHIGTNIIANSRKVHSGSGTGELSDEEVEDMRRGLAQRGIAADGLSVEDLRGFMKMFEVGFRDNAPMTAAEAATVILDGVRNERWRILVGADALRLDEAVRADPESVYGATGLTLGTIIGQ
jgi:hypothetical protein